MRIIYLLTYLFFCSSYLFIIIIIIFLQQLLRVHLSDNLNWNEHVTVKKASKLLYAIFALKEVRTNCQAAYSSLLQHNQFSLRVCQLRFGWPHAIFNTTSNQNKRVREKLFSVSVLRTSSRCSFQVKLLLIVQSSKLALTMTFRA